MTKQQVATREEAPEPVVSEATAIVQMIDRAARDQTVDVTKMRELLAMRKEIVAEAAEREFNDAMTEAQQEMRPVAADLSNTHTKSKYASYIALDRAMRPIYTKHAFSLSFNTAEGAPEGHVRAVCDVSRGGYTRRYQIDMPADGKGAKSGDVMTKTHAMGAAMTYAQRYLLKMIFNIAVGLDDDGNAAGANDPISPEQVAELRRLIDLYGAEEPKILAHAVKLAGHEIEKIEDMPVRVYDRTLAALTDWARKQRGAG